MRFALLSLVDVMETPFISLLIYETDERGISHEIGDTAKPYSDINELISDLIAYDINELQTDSPLLYRDLVAERVPVIYRREIEGTRKRIECHIEMLVELFELDKQNDEQAVALPRWRVWCIKKLEQIVQILKTKGIKKDGN